MNALELEVREALKSIARNKTMKACILESDLLYSLLCKDARKYISL